MNTDIIALATKCGFSTVEDRTIYLSKYSKEKLHDCILKLATLLEAEIRKEYEGRIYELEQKIAVGLREDIIRRDVELVDLTEKNAKLMEFVGEIVTFGGKYQYLNGTEIVQDAYALLAALTPHPENREGRE